MIKVYNDNEELIYSVKSNNRDSIDFNFLRDTGYTGILNFYINNELFRRDYRKNGEYFNLNGPALYIWHNTETYFWAFYSLGNPHNYWIDQKEWLESVKALEYNQSFEQMLGDKK